jgi:hypothetical protein
MLNFTFDTESIKMHIPEWSVQIENSYRSKGKEPRLPFEKEYGYILSPTTILEHNTVKLALPYLLHGEARKRNIKELVTKKNDLVNAIDFALKFGTIHSLTFGSANLSKKYTESPLFAVFFGGITGGQPDILADYKIYRQVVVGEKSWEGTVKETFSILVMLCFRDLKMRKGLPF